MESRIPKTQHQESFKRIKNDFGNIPDEQLKALYWKYCSRLERDAVVLDFIPILVEKTVKNHFLQNSENFMPSDGYLP